jgi:signal transduction histidine kinase
MSQPRAGPSRARSFAQVAGEVAHDIANMVTIILTCTEQLARKLEPDHPAQQEVQEILLAAQRAASLTRELLTFAQRRSAPPRLVDLHEVLASLHPLLRRMTGEDVRVEMSFGATDARVLGDRDDIEQVFLNLALNARDAMPRGGLLSLATSQQHHSPVQLEVTVRDTGVGMDESTRARVFEPFFSTKHSERGTGIGLSVVASVVEGMGGSITVASVPGQGSTFRILLPVVSED